MYYDSVNQFTNGVDGEVAALGQIGRGKKRRYFPSVTATDIINKMAKKACILGEPSNLHLIMLCFT